MGLAGNECKRSIALLGAPEATLVLRSRAHRAAATDVLGEFSAPCEPAPILLIGPVQTVAYLVSREECFFSKIALR